jgi:hypothetical protein
MVSRNIKLKSYFLKFLCVELIEGYLIGSLFYGCFLLKVAVGNFNLIAISVGLAICRSLRCQNSNVYYALCKRLRARGHFLCCWAKKVGGGFVYEFGIYF